MPLGAVSHRHDLRAIAQQAMIERGLLPSFSAAVLAQARGMAGAAPGAGPEVRDLRDRLWASIDNDDSRDLDQLSVAEPLPDGAVKVLVAVADVDAAVAAGSAIDGHAQHNTTSVYTIPEIFPMLPERLSTDLTSLNEGQERLAIVVEMTIDRGGACVASDLYRARVLNRAKLAYNGVAAWLDGRGPILGRIAAVSGLEGQIRLQDRVAQILKAVRHKRGALGLETIEARAFFEGDRLADLRPEETNRAKELIEDFMIAANEVTVRYLGARRFPSLRRVLRSPERWARIVEVASETGWKLPPVPDAQALNEFLMERRTADPLRFPDLSLAVIKLLGSGEYVVDSPGGSVPGHFGLAVDNYTHSTAPNRRFPDLITQRLLKAAMAGRPAPYGPAELQDLALRCTEKEDDAKKVERRVEKSAAALLLEPRLGERFDAVVTSASEKGTWVRVLRPPVEGKLVRGADGLDVGHTLRVELVGTDVERGFIDFALAPRTS